MTRNAANEAFARHAQARLGVKVDGWAGPVTRASFDEALPPVETTSPSTPEGDQITAVAQDVTTLTSELSAPEGDQITAVPLDIDPGVFFERVRATLFDGRLSSGAVEGMTGILAAFEAVGDGKPDTLAYALATAYHETGRRMVPVREGFATTDAGARRAVLALAQRRGPNSAVARYAQPQPPYGHVYYGRGHVQLTWLDNYRRSSADVGTDLVRYPDAILDPILSAQLLIIGLLDGRWNGQGHGLRHYLDQGDWRSARRTVNILDKADEIAGQGQRFLAAISAAHKE